LVSIGVGILNTISSYFSWARKAESHRIAYLQYSKLFSIIRVEMSLPRSERKQADQLLAQIRDGMERLAETTPSPPPSILDEFNRHFKDEDKTISRPVEVNGLQKVLIFRPPSVPTKLDEVKIEIKNPLHVEHGTEGSSYPQGHYGRVQHSSQAYLASQSVPRHLRQESQAQKPWQCRLWRGSQH
jgi:hypothetical protein